MDIIDEQRAAGATVLMVTHQMEEVERLCDRIILLKDGAARAYGTVTEVQEEFGGLTITLDYSADHSGSLPKSKAYGIVSQGGGHAVLSVDTGADLAGFLKGLMDAGVTVSRFEPRRRSLDDIFVEVYGDEADRGEGSE
jgi:ABC-2 type transport system ATP-binding protein